MEKVDKSNFLAVWGTIGLLCMLGVWFTPWRFQTNDDVIMMWLVSGAYTGTPEKYAVFIHPSLSLLFSFLYELTEILNWYGFVWYLILFGAYLGMVKVISDRIATNFLKTSLVTFALIITLHFCLFPQFTLVAGWAGIAGFLLLFKDNERVKSNFDLILAFFLMFFALLVRLESFALVGLAFGLYSIWERRIQFLFKNWKTLTSIIFLFLLVYGSKRLYENQSRYQEYLVFNEARSGVIDHPVFYHLYREGKIVEREWFYFARWMIDDLEISVEELRLKKSELNELLFSREYVLKSFFRLKTIATTELFKSSIALILLLLLFYIKGGKPRLWGFLLTWLLFFLLMNYFFLLQGRVLVLFALVLWFPLILSEGLVRRKVSLKWLPLALVSLFLLHLLNAYRESEGRKQMNAEFKELLSYMTNESPIFTEGFFEYNYLERFSTTFPVPALSYGWLSQSPFQDSAFKNHGFSSMSSLNEFYLLQVKSPEKALFPEYIEYLDGDLELLESKSGEFFNFFHYSKK
ncbi:hypothetical protein ACFOSV_11955 [Algoriphagus namhaensis]|uniref:Glycosyltransferase RgtA/B/C/D-like domain-containing protein n=1 Tax=Algoriphagus namhaensis TaxID=915353 RepID=A0ABV8AUF1_9BACT